MQQNKLHRIYINKDIQIDKKIEINIEKTIHLKNVLRIKNNQNIIIFNGNGAEYLAEITYLEKTIAYVKKENRRKALDVHNIVLAQSISSSKHMDFSIQKSVELGINHVVPIVSSRSHPGNYDNKIKHWEKIIINAVEQSNGLYIPKLSPIITFDEYIKADNLDQYHKICFHIKGRNLNETDKSKNSHIMLIGPEGGFSDSEISSLEKFHWNIISLGDRIFRTETASIVAQTILRN